ncbi:MAG: V-type ATP synthase subunit D [Candidatus Auribacterota bacterium]|jgi:V/A-type H+-transporting ATPase subunit D|nr:V-type ATP synthase subunit D [Candidatus Auribacterota bacterium]
MARYQIAPTKTNLLNLKQQRGFALEGHELLEQKRDILIAELMGMINTAHDIQEKVDEYLSESYRLLEKALISNGKDKLAKLAKTMPISSRVDVATRKVMGIALPSVDVSVSEKKPYYSFLHTDREIDATVIKFREILDLIGKLAQSRISVLRLAKEAQKTIRRVNALEKIYLPDYEESIEYIQNMLEESERESFFVLKLIKNRMKKRT